MTCDICGSKKAHLKKMTKSYGSGKKLFVVENIPTYHCSSCGENYLKSKTLHELERIKLHQNSLAKIRPIPVVHFK